MDDTQIKGGGGRFDAVTDSGYDFALVLFFVFVRERGFLNLK